jgi:hypothetical protein
MIYFYLAIHTHHVLNLFAPVFSIRPAIPAVVNAISKPTNTYKAVDELMATTFVATVDASTLSILCPILSRGLKEKNAVRQCSCCVVIENMSRLVDILYWVESTKREYRTLPATAGRDLTI